MASQKTVRARFKRMSACARRAGIKPGKKWSAADRKKVARCMGR